MLPVRKAGSSPPVSTARSSSWAHQCRMLATPSYRNKCARAGPVTPATECSRVPPLASLDAGRLLSPTRFLLDASPGTSCWVVDAAASTPQLVLHFQVPGFRCDHQPVPVPDFRGYVASSAARSSFANAHVVLASSCMLAYLPHGRTIANAHAIELASLPFGCTVPNACAVLASSRVLAYCLSASLLQTLMQLKSHRT